MIGDRYRWPTIAVLTLCLLGGLIREARAADQLLNAQGLAGTFVQVVIDDRGEVLAESRGEFALRKPHFLRWRITEPGQQLIVADGTWLWQYDLDLETVARAAMDTGDNSPLRLLLEPVEALTDRYHIERGDQQVTLRHKNASSLFQALTVVFRDNWPTRIELFDTLGQTVRIALEIRDETVPPLTLFEFEPPVDLPVSDLSR